jgi:hypothetical protein
VTAGILAIVYSFHRCAIVSDPPSGKTSPHIGFWTSTVSVAVYQSRHGALLISTQHRHLFALVSQRTLEGEPLLGHMPWGVAERWLGMRGGRTGFSQVRGMAHSPQNSVPVGFSDSSRGQRMGAPSDTAARVVGAYGQKPRRPSRIDMGWMVCQYSRAGLVSSEKHQVTPGTGMEGRGGHTAGVGLVTVVMAVFGLGPSGLRSAAEWLN